MTINQKIERDDKYEYASNDDASKKITKGN